MENNERKAEHNILDLLLNRWSPRAMTGKSMPDSELYRLFEAARWAPSCYNSQPWRLIYGHKDDDGWQKLYNLQVDFNKQWTINSSVLILVISYKLFPWNLEPNATHSFDTGAAMENMALQAASMGLVMHGMAGFDYEKARKEFNIPHTYNIEAMFAIGYPADPKTLPKELQDREKKSAREPIKSFCFKGKFIEQQREQ